MKIKYTLAALVTGGSILAAGAAVPGAGKLDIRSQQTLITKYNATPGRHAAVSRDRNVQLPATVGTIITLDDADNVSQLEAIGITIDAVIGTRAVAYLTPAQLDAVQQLDCVTLVSLSRQMRLDNDLMRQATNIDLIHEGTTLTQPYNGEGVLVGLYDSGMQPNHLNFLDADGNSRVKRLYVYSDGMQSYTEKEYTTPAQIKSFTTENSEGTHGTHVLGIAAGSYTDGNGDYSGVAPAVDLAVACGTTDDAAILKGVSRLIAYARSEKKPIVINLSLGDIMGPHDGSDSFAAALDQLAATTPICISSGNSGDLGLALTKTLNADGDNQVRTTIAGNSSLTALNKGLKGQRWDAQGTYEIYADDERPFKLEIGIIDKNTGEMLYTVPVEEEGAVYATSTSGNASYAYSEFLDQYYTNSYISVVTGVAENNRYLASINLSLLKKAPFNNDIMPAIIITGAGGTQRIDMHTNSSYNLFAASGLEGWDDATVDGSNNNLTCGKNVIGVGAYTTRITAPYEFGELGTVAPFSGSAKLVDGTQRPHFCTPGHALISSLSTNFRTSSAYSRSQFPIAQDIEKDGMHYYWTPMSGTSMAAPVATGTIALWLQANPELTPAEIKQIAIETAVPQEPVSRWGAGRLDGMAGLKRAIEMLSSVTTVAADNDAKPMVTRSGNTYTIYVPGKDNFDVQVYNMAGMPVAHATGRNGEAVVNLDANPSGVYVLNADGTSMRIAR